MSKVSRSVVAAMTPCIDLYAIYCRCWPLLRPCRRQTGQWKSMSAIASAKNERSVKASESVAQVKVATLSFFAPVELNKRASHTLVKATQPKTEHESDLSHDLFGRTTHTIKGLCIAMKDQSIRRRSSVLMYAISCSSRVTT